MQLKSLEKQMKCHMQVHSTLLLQSLQTGLLISTHTLNSLNKHQYEETFQTVVLQSVGFFCDIRLTLRYKNKYCCNLEVSNPRQKMILIGIG